MTVSSSIGPRHRFKCVVVPTRVQIVHVLNQVGPDDLSPLFEACILKLRQTFDRGKSLSSLPLPGPLASPMLHALARCTTAGRCRSCGTCSAMLGARSSSALASPRKRARRTGPPRAHPSRRCVHLSANEGLRACFSAVVLERELLFRIDTDFEIGNRDWDICGQPQSALCDVVCC